MARLYRTKEKKKAKRENEKKKRKKKKETSLHHGMAITWIPNTTSVHEDMLRQQHLKKTFLHQHAGAMYVAACMLVRKHYFTTLGHPPYSQCLSS